MEPLPVGAFADGFFRCKMPLLTTFISPLSTFPMKSSSLKMRRRCQLQRAISVELSLTLRRELDMLSVDQISNAVSEVSAQRMSIEEFERWFRKGSRNFHACGDPNLIGAIFAVEAVLSEYRFAGMHESSARLELVNAVRPFEQPKVGPAVQLPSAPVRVQSSLAGVHKSSGIEAVYSVLAAKGLAVAKRPKLVRKPAGSAAVGNSLVDTDSATQKLPDHAVLA